MDLNRNIIKKIKNANVEEQKKYLYEHRKDMKKTRQEFTDLLGKLTTENGDPYFSDDYIKEKILNIKINE